jgi:hypothetical protein
LYAPAPFTLALDYQWPAFSPDRIFVKFALHVPEILISHATYPMLLNLPTAPFPRELVLLFRLGVLDGFFSELIQITDFSGKSL